MGDWPYVAVRQGRLSNLWNRHPCGQSLAGEPESLSPLRPLYAVSTPALGVGVMTAPRVSSDTPWIPPPTPSKGTGKWADGHMGEQDPFTQSLIDLIHLGSVTSARSVQPTIGMSQIGHACDRRIAYLTDRTPKTNFGDPLKLLVGIGLHLALREIFIRLDAGSGRFLVEESVVYRDIPGSFDLFDRFTRTVIDWKSTTKARLSQYRKEGPPRSYLVQAQGYAAALRGRGEDVRQIAIVFLPVDGTLGGIWAYRAEVNPTVADDAIDRVDAIRGKDPAVTPATPDRLCPWCDHYQPASTDLRIGCPGSQQLPEQRGK